MTYIHHFITYSFFITEHTKFAAYCHFCVIKKAYNLNFVSSIYDVADKVEASSLIGLNRTQLVDTHNN